MNVIQWKRVKYELLLATAVVLMADIQPEIKGSIKLRFASRAWWW